MARWRSVVICKALTILFSKKLQRQIEKRLLKKKPKQTTSQLYIYFSSSFYTLSWKYLADVSEHGHKTVQPFLGMGSIARCTVSTAGPRGTRSRSQSDSSSPGKSQRGFPSHEHWLLSSHRLSWRGMCCLHDFFPAPALSGSPGMTNHCSPLVFSCCKFSHLPKCSKPW